MPKAFFKSYGEPRGRIIPTQDFLPRYKSDSLAARERIEQGDQLMSKHVTISPTEAADRLAIRELVEAYAHCADRRDAKGQMSLFTENAHFVVYMNAKDSTPSQELHSREALAPVFAELNKYDATTHFVGQSTIFTLTDDRGAGEAYCLAHHITIDGGKLRLMLASLRYLDTFVRWTVRGCLRSACSLSIGSTNVRCHE